MLLLGVVPLGRGAVLAPGLELEEEGEGEGRTRELARVRAVDPRGREPGDVHDAREEDVDFDGAVRGRAVPEYLVCRERLLRWDEVEGRVGGHEPTLDLFLVITRVQDEDVEILE